MTGNWRERFEPRHPSNPPPSASEPPRQAETRPPAGAAPFVDPFSGEGALSPRPQSTPPDEDGPALDLSTYRPWILQRGRGRPAMMLEFRRYEPRSGLWTGWAASYPHLVGLEYTGDRMLSLDFGTKQFMIEGVGLDELARHVQQGSVMVVQEYAREIWPKPIGCTLVKRITKALTS